MPLDDQTVAIALENIEDEVRSGFPGLAPNTDQGRPVFQAELHDADDLDDDEIVARTERGVAVPWVYRCTHVDDFLGVPATWVNLELRGATFVRVTDDDPLQWEYYRYIDYIGALHQMGVSVISRPALTPRQFAEYQKHPPPAD
jgi:hypothetical protein